MTAFGGLEDPEVSAEALEAWRQQTDGSFSRRMFPGDHFYLNDARDGLLDVMMPHLVRASG